MKPTGIWGAEQALIEKIVLIDLSSNHPIDPNLIIDMISHICGENNQDYCEIQMIVRNNKDIFFT